MSGVDTVLPADSVEFCPAPMFHQLLACGTYQLEEAPVSSESSSSQEARRWGKCLLYEVDEESDECRPLQEITLPAVLDMKWSSTLLAIADSEGHVVLQHLQEENRSLVHTQTLTCVPEDQKAICLSLDWAKYRLENSSDVMAASLSNGTVLVAKPLNTGMVVTDTWKAHEFEPWITAWDRWDLNLVYTGGDDCKFKGWDIRAGFTQPVFVNNRFHGGVTSIQSNSHMECTVAVGSYDGMVRLFDMRWPLQNVLQTDVEGGAWRVKWHPDVSRRHLLLAACMHNGFKIIDFERPNSTDAQSECRGVLARFDQHRSLAYGVDWSHAIANKDGTLVATCSFYDHLLHLWRG